MAESYPPTSHTTALRDRQRVSYERAAVHRVLDEAYHCHLAFVSPDGDPRVLPTLHVRLGETLYLHGSTGSRPMLAARDAGLPVSVAVTLLDGLVCARSQVHHSANYRSVVAHGLAQLVTDEQTKRRVLTALVDKVGPGRAAQCRAPSRKELAETAVLALPLAEVSLKARTGGVSEDPADLALPVWAGVVPLQLVAGAPEPDAGVTAAPPAYLPRPRLLAHHDR